ARAQPLLDLAALARQITAPVTAYRFSRQPALVASVLEVRDENLGGEPIVGEDQRLLIAIQQFERDAPRFADVAAADAKLPVHDGRIPADEDLLSRRSAIAVDQFDRRFEQRLGELFRVGDGSRAGNKLRLRAI